LLDRQVAEPRIWTPLAEISDDTLAITRAAILDYNNLDAVGWILLRQHCLDAASQEVRPAVGRNDDAHAGERLVRPDRVTRTA
jgi:hypothetical protein